MTVTHLTPQGVDAFIISLDPVPRNSKLFSELSSQGFRTHLVQAVDGRRWEFPFDPNDIDVKQFKRIVGRIPTGPEIGCALSHLRCARLAVDCEYALVIEEDATIYEDLHLAVRALQFLDSGNPLILQLYSTPASVLRRETLTEVDKNSGSVVARFFSPPNYAVAYLMNRAAIKAFSKRQRVEGVADWPPFAHAFEFWGHFPNPVGHSTVGSTIEDSRKQVIRTAKSKNKFIQAFLNYIRIFNFARVVAHSRSLGSFSAYVRTVIIPHTIFLLRYPKTSTYGSGPQVFKVR